VVLTSGHLRERFGALPLGVDYMPKPWAPLNLLVAAKQALGRGSICSFLGRATVRPSSRTLAKWVCVGHDDGNAPTHDGKILKYFLVRRPRKC
jgi:hypothetical protein